MSRGSSNPVRTNRSPVSVLEHIDDAVKRRYFANASALSSHLNSPNTNSNPRRRVYLVQGLPLDLLPVLELHFNINSSFFESHLQRRPYFHYSWHRPGPKNTNAFSVTYPEIAKWHNHFECQQRFGDSDYGIEGSPNLMKTEILLDPSEDPFSEVREVLSYGRYEGLGAILNHAAAWSQSTDHGGIDSLLLLDLPVWTYPSSSVRKNFYKEDPIKGALDRIPREQETWYPSCPPEIITSSLEDLICDILERDRDIPDGQDFLSPLLHEISIAKWEAYLDSYLKSVSASFGAVPKTSNLGCRLLEQQSSACKHALDHLEWNLRVEAHKCTQANGQMHNFRIENWRHLKSGFEGARTPVDFYEANQTPTLSSALSAKSPVSLQSGLSNDERMADAEAGAKTAQQSLNRLAYLGGIFLPFSIIAAIFSMGADFAAGEPRFYVFWVVAIPLALGVIATIYADSIRHHLIGGELKGGSEESSADVAEVQATNLASTRPSRLYATEDVSASTPRKPLGWLRAYATIFGYTSYKPKK